MKVPLWSWAASWSQKTCLPATQKYKDRLASAQKENRRERRAGGHERDASRYAGSSPLRLNSRSWGGSMGSSLAHANARAAEQALEDNCPLACFLCFRRRAYARSADVAMQLAKPRRRWLKCRNVARPAISVFSTDPTMGGVSPVLAGMLGDLNVEPCPDWLAGLARYRTDRRENRCRDSSAVSS